MSELVLVTGGAGFIGSHLVDDLLETGVRVRVLDNLTTGHKENLSQCLSDIEFVEVDLRDIDGVRVAMTGVDSVYHLAALGSVPRSVADPITSHEVNATGTLHVLVAAKDADTRQVVIASSSSVFGSNRQMPKTEDMTGRPLSPYATTKAASEHYAMNFAGLFGLDASVVRFFNVFGPRQRADHPYAAVIPRFIHAAITGATAEVHGDGLQSRDFTYVSNAVNGLLCVGAAPAAITAGTAFHIACGGSLSLLDVLNEISRIRGHEVPRHFIDSRPGDIRDSQASIDKARELVGYNPAVLGLEGVEPTYRWMEGIVTARGRSHG